MVSMLQATQPWHMLFMFTCSIALYFLYIKCHNNKLMKAYMHQILNYALDVWVGLYLTQERTIILTSDVFPVRNKSCLSAKFPV